MTNLDYTIDPSRCISTSVPKTAQFIKETIDTLHAESYATAPIRQLACLSVVDVRTDVTLQARLATLDEAMHTSLVDTVRRLPPGIVSSLGGNAMRHYSATLSPEEEPSQFVGANMGRVLEERRAPCVQQQRDVHNPAAMGRYPTSSSNESVEDRESRNSSVSTVADSDTSDVVSTSSTNSNVDMEESTEGLGSVASRYNPPQLTVRAVGRTSRRPAGSVKRKRPGGPQQVMTASKKTRQANRPIAAPTSRCAETHPRSVDDDNDTPRKPLKVISAPDIGLLIDGLKSREAIKQFLSLVNSRRGSDNKFRISSSDRYSRTIDYLRAATDNSLYASFMMRFSEFSLATCIDTSIRDGYLRASPAVLKDARKRLGWADHTFDDRLAQGRRWRGFYENYEGLLCFFFLEKNEHGIKPKSYQDRTLAIDTFRDCLDDDYIQSINVIGQAFLRLFVEPDDFEFRWERHLSRLRNLLQLPDADLLSELQPYPPSAEYKYISIEFAKHQRPVNWPQNWPWPAHPMVEGVVGCDLCGKNSCDCQPSHPQFRPRIKYYDNTCLGIQALGKTQGGIAYRKGEIIGWRFGKVVPVGTAKDVWAVDFVRPDINAKVCEIDSCEYGNCFKFLRRRENPSVRLVPKKVSCKYMIAVVAQEDIRDGMEITQPPYLSKAY